LGCAPLTVYIESASGIREGGRTGITAIVVAIGFFISLFLTPLIASIPPFATGPALILVGAMMMENLIDIDWADVRQAVPAFITIVVMPLTYSIAYGVIAGVCSYLLLYAANFGLDMVDVARGKRSKEDVMYENCPDAFQVRFMLVCGWAWIVGRIWGEGGHVVWLCWVGCAGLDGLVCIDGTHTLCGPRLSAYIIYYAI
jgi:xanthine/uracil/vitamin C permease (AzgA family)